MRRFGLAVLVCLVLAASVTAAPFVEGGSDPLSETCPWRHALPRTDGFSTIVPVLWFA